MDLKYVLKTLCENHGPSGREYWLHKEIKEIFKGVDKGFTDNIDNFHIIKKGRGNGKIMLSAHLDEVFLMVNSIKDNGFLGFIGKGIDPKTLVSQEVIVHGKESILGIIGIKPPHLMNDKEREEGVKIEELFIDTGYSKESLEKIVSVGDSVTLKRDFIELLNNNICCKALDDRASIGALYVCFEELKNKNHDLDVHFVCSSQEEVGHRGAKVASHIINPNIGIAIDTTFDGGHLGRDDDEVKVGGGPCICIGPNIHPKLRKKLMKIAEKNKIPYQVEVEPGNTGTDAWDIQVSREGIATLLISIPIKYMHTSVEVANLGDIKNTGKLLADFIMSIKYDELEEILCF